MAAPEPDRTSIVESSSWRPLLAIILAAFGTYAVLAAVLAVSATEAGPHALLWLSGPVLFFAAALAALVISRAPVVRVRLAAVGSWFVGRPVNERVIHYESSVRRAGAEGLSDAARNS
jgi:hypothetical protein